MKKQAFFLAAIFFVSVFYGCKGHKSPESPGEIAAGSTWLQATDSTDFPARNLHETVVFKDNIWVLGGEFHDDAWCSSDGINWTEKISTAPFGNRVGVCLAFNNKLWIISGNTQDPAWEKADSWSSEDGENWILESDDLGFSSRRWHSGVVFDNKMWIIGGYDYFGAAHNDVWSSSDGINWVQETSSANFPRRWGHESVVFDNKIWVIGGNVHGNPGGDAGGKPNYNDAWYSSDGKNWTLATDDAPFTARDRFSMAVYDGYMWVMGGLTFTTDPTSYLCDIWKSSDGVNWTQVTSCASFGKRYGHASVVFNNSIFVIAGKFESNVLNDVWFSF